MWAAILWSVVALVGAAVVWVCWRLHAPHHPTLPGPPHTSWFYGNSQTIMVSLKTGQHYLETQANFERFGRKFYNSVLGSVLAWFADADVAREIVNLKTAGPTKLFVDAFSLVTEGLLVLRGEKWARHRALCQKAFTVAALRNVVSAVNRTIPDLIARWEHDATAGTSTEVRVDLAVLTTTVLSRVILGCEPVDAGLEHMDDIIRSIAVRIRVPKFIWRFMFADQKLLESRISVLRQKLHAVVQTKRKNLGDARQSGSKEHEYDDLITIMLNQQSHGDLEDSLQDKEILDETLMFYVAGHETTTNSLAFVIYALALHPDVQQKAFEEVTSVCGEDGDVTWDQVGEFTYLEMVIKETMRLWPVAPVVVRQTEKNETFGGHVVTPATTVMVSVRGLHRDPEYWPDPLTFNPDRFREPAKAGTYMPFGGGQRLCIGNRFAILEMKAVLAHFVRKFSFTLDADKPVVPAFFITMGPRTGVHVHLKTRAESASDR